MKSFVFIILALSTALAEAAPSKGLRINYSSYRSSILSDSVAENRVMIDTAPLLMNGVGLAYERSLFPQVTLGPYISFFKLTSDQNKTSGIAFQSDVRMYGIRGRYFLSEETHRSGVYVMLGLGAVDVKTEAAYSNLAGSAASTALGGIGGAGYQFVAREVSSGKMAFGVGATYANGYSVENQARFYSTGQTEVDQPKAIGSIFLEGNIAFLF